MSALPPIEPSPQSGTESEQFSCTLAACDGAARRGRPSVAEAEQLSGRILDASWEVLLQGGFEHFTFDRVARHARIGKATIYSRFAGKNELLTSLLMRRIEFRREKIMAHGKDLPVMESFCLRATEFLLLIASPEGVLMERLTDWLDQESSAGETRGTRALVYAHAIHSITHSFQEAVEKGQLTISDVHQAARFWLEGLLGHARLIDGQTPASREEHERWALSYGTYFFAGVAALDRDPA